MASINPGTGAIDLGEIQSESQTKDAGLFQQAIPRTDSTDMVLSDLLGTTRTINISGTIIGSTVADLTTFISNIEGICDGTQNGSAYIGSLVTSSKNVYIQTFDWSYDSGQPLILTYSLTLIEGSSLEVSE